MFLLRVPPQVTAITTIVRPTTTTVATTEKMRTRLGSTSSVPACVLYGKTPGTFDLSCRAPFLAIPHTAPSAHHQTLGWTAGAALDAACNMMKPLVNEIYRIGLSPGFPPAGIFRTFERMVSLLKQTSCALQKKKMKILDTLSSQREMTMKVSQQAYHTQHRRNEERHCWPPRLAGSSTVSRRLRYQENSSSHR